MPDNPLGALPGLARLGVSAYIDGVRWVGTQYVRGGARVIEAATTGESLGHLLGEAGQTTRSYAREVLGIEDVARKVDSAMPATAATANENGEFSDAQVRGTLRDRGTALLDASADVHARDEAHPAYARILDELDPDEARILRYLTAEGAQPAIDVRTSRPLDIGSQMVAPGLQMLGCLAGCRRPERVPADLNNLYRLGLIWFSREPLVDPLRYQVLEAQPDVLEAMRKAGRGKTVRRSIALTPFGDDFCTVCLPPPRVARSQDVLGAKAGPPVTTQQLT